MKRVFWFILIVAISASCSKMDVDEDLPTTQNLNPSSMVSELDRISIEADPGRVKAMVFRPHHKIIVPATVVYYDAQGEILFTQEANMEIRGAASAEYDMKPLGLQFKEPIDNSSGKILPLSLAQSGQSLTTLQSLRLRNSGQDYGNTMIKDLAYSYTAQEMNMGLDIKYGKPIHAFLNGEYYGLLNLRNELDPLALSHLYGVDTSSITLVKLDNKNGNLEHKNGDESKANSLREAIKSQDLSRLEQLVDVENFIQYVAYEDYAGNFDWPYNNVAAYSINNEPFKFLLFDLDMSAIRSKLQLLPQLEYRDDDLSRMYQVFWEQRPGFQNQLRMAQKKTYKGYSSERFNLIVNKLAADIDNEIAFLISKRSAPSSQFQWKMNLEQLKRNFKEHEKSSRKFYDI